jgi:transcription initiation factor TFIIIB Brf1 subunit/transcription initiation factor TFIIB
MNCFEESSYACVECGCDDYVFDRTTCDEICRTCGVVRQTVLFDEDAGFCDHRRCQTNEEVVMSAALGKEYFFGGNCSDKPKGVSKSVVAESSRNSYSDREKLLEKFASTVRARCHARTGILTNVQSTALEIFDVFASRAHLKCPKAKITSRNVPIYAAVCLQMASKIEKCERTDVEMQNLFDVTPKRFSSASSHVLVSLADHPLHSRISAMSRPLAMAPRVLDALGDFVSDDARRAIRRAVGSREYEDAEMALVEGGASGNVVAGALIHIASGKVAPLHEISKIIGYTQTALKNACSKAETLLKDGSTACE